MTEDKRKIDIVANVDATDAKASLADLGNTAAGVSKRIGNAGREAAAGVDAIGAASGKSAKELAASERSIRASIQRTTAVLEAGERGSRKYYEAIAAQRGFSAGAFQEDLAKLDAAHKKRMEAIQSVDQMGRSAKEMAWAMRGVPAQFTDIFTSLAAGQNPMTVFLQQGGQLKDMFGGAGVAAKALGGYVLGLVNPFTVVAAAAGLAAVAYNQGSKEADAYRAALILTGNAAGSTAERLADMAGRVSTATGATKGAAAEAIAALAGSGNIAAASMQGVAEASIRMARVTGESVANVVKQFDELGRSPAAASAKLNEQYRYLTAEIYAQIKALEDQGRTAEAAAIAQRTFADAMTDRAKQVEAGLGELEKAWKNLKSEAKKTWDAMLDIGRPDTLTEKLAKAQAALEDRRKGNWSNWTKTESLESDVAHLQEIFRLQSRSLAVQEAQNQKREAALQFEKDGEKFLTKQQQMEAEILRIRTIGLAAGAKEEEIARRIAIVREKYAEKPKKERANNDAQQIFSAQIAAEKDHSKALVDIIQERVKQRVLTEREGVNQILAAQNDGFVRQAEILKSQLSATKDPGEREKIKQQIAALGNAAMVAAEQAASGLRKIEDAALKSRQDYMKGLGDETASLLKKAQAAEEENARIGQSADALARLTMVRYDEAIALKTADLDRAKTAGGREGEVALIEEQIDALRRLRIAETNRPFLQAQVKAAEEARREWEKTAETIERALTDSLMRSFESGKGFGEAFRDSIANLFKTLVLRPVVQAIVQPVAGQITNAIGIGGQGSAGNLLSAGNSAWNLYNGGFAAPGGMYHGFATSNIGQALGLSATAGSLGAIGTGVTTAATAPAIAAGATGVEAAMAAGAMKSSGLALSGAGATIGAALPWIAGAVALASLFGGNEPDTVRGKIAIGKGLSFEDNAGIKSRYGDIGFVDSATENFSGKVGATFAQGLVASLDAISAAYGDQKDVADRLAASVQSVDFGSLDGTYTTEDFLKNYAENLSKGIIRTVAGADLGGDIAALLTDSAITALTGTQAQALVTGIEQGWIEPMLATMPEADRALAGVADRAVELAATLPTLAAKFGVTADLIGQSVTTALTQSTSAAQAGEAFAGLIGNGIYDALQGQYAAGISQMVMGEIVNPMLVALATGGDLAAALADGVIEDAVQKIDALATTYSTLLNSAEFTGAMDRLNAALNRAGQAAFVPQAPRYQIEAAKELEKASEDAAKAAEEAAKAAADLLAGIQKETADIQRQIDQMGMGEWAQALDDAARHYADQAAEIAKLTTGQEAATAALNGWLTAQEKLIDLQRKAAYEATRQGLEGRYGSGAEQQAAAYNRMTATLVAAGMGDYGTILARLQAGSLGELRSIVEGMEAVGDATLPAREALLAIAGDFATLKDAAVDAAYAGVERAVDAQKKALQDAADAQIKALRTQAETASKGEESARTLQSTLDTLFETITDGARGLRGTLDSLDTWNQTQARAALDSALAITRAGGTPDRDRLAAAIQTIQRDSVDRFASAKDFEFAQLVAAGKLDEMGGLIGAQKSAAELALEEAERQSRLLEEQIAQAEDGLAQQLAALDAQLQSARDQIDVMRGVDLSVKSVGEAIAHLTATVAQINLTPPSSLAGGSTKPASGGAASSSGGSSGASGSTLTGLPTTPAFAAETAWVSSQIAAAGGITDAVARSIYDAAQTGGYNSSTVAAVLSDATGKLVSQRDVLDWAKAQGLPHFASGGYASPGVYVAGERGPEVIAAPVATRIFNAGDTSRLMGGGDLAAENRLLREEVKALREDMNLLLRSINRHASVTASAVDGIASGEAIVSMKETA